MAELDRRLTRFDLMMIVIGSSIGSGIFLTPADIARSLGSPVLILGIWVLGGLMTLSGALTYAELGALMPRAGGVYVFLTRAYGDLPGFLYGWANFLVITTGSIAALAVAFADTVGYFVDLDAWTTKLVAIAALAIVTSVNVYGVKAGAIMTNAMTLLKLAGIVFVICVGLFAGSSHTSDFGSLERPEGFATAVSAALVGVLWSYGGWQHATFTAAETKRPTRDVPQALAFGALAIIAFYLLTNLAYMFLLTPAEIGSTKNFASVAVGTRVGAVGGALIALTVIFSTFGTAGIYTMTAPRMYYAMAQRGLFFASMAKVNPKTRTPVVAIVLQSAWSMVLVLLWGTFKNLISYVVFTEWIFYALTAASIFVFRRRLPSAERPYRVPGYPITPLFFVAVSTWFVVNTLIGKPLESLAGIGVVLLGIPIFLIWRRVAAKDDRVAQPESD